MNTANQIENQEMQEEKVRSLWKQSLIQFKHNRLAVAGFVIILLFIVVILATIGIDLATNYAFYGEYIVKQDLTLRLAKPSLAHPFGCDEFGRDLLLRILWGTKLSMAIGVVAISLSVIMGAPFGMIAAFYGGKVDNVIMRVMDVLLAVPYMLLAMAIVAGLGTSTVNLLLALAVSGIAKYARIARAAVLTVKDSEFVEAARAVGASDATILFKYILPNALAPILVQISLGIGDSILAVAGLSYLGLGVQPPQPEWGAILTTARTYMRDAWHISVFPGLFLVLAVIAFNLFGAGPRDALVPKLKRYGGKWYGTLIGNKGFTGAVSHGGRDGICPKPCGPGAGRRGNPGTGGRDRRGQDHSGQEHHAAHPQSAGKDRGRNDRI